MITVVSRFQLRPELDHDTALAEIQETIDWYRGRPGCIRKYVCLNEDQRYGIGVYLWEDRPTAEAFYAAASAEIERQTGAAPELTYFDTPVVVDNRFGEVFIDGVRSEFEPSVPS